jgi:hypothetical protein
MKQGQLSWYSGFIPSRSLIYEGPKCLQGHPAPKSTEDISLGIMGPGHGTTTHLELQSRLRMCASTPPLCDIPNDNITFCSLLLFLLFLFFLEFNDITGCLMEKGQSCT